MSRSSSCYPTFKHLLLNERNFHSVIQDACNLATRSEFEQNTGTFHQRRKRGLFLENIYKEENII